MNTLTTLLIITGAATWACAFMYGIIRLGAWCDGRPW